MVYTLGQYIQDISMVIIFTTFINLIMPNSDFEKYIKIVLGLIVIITVLGPINKFVFKNKPNYTDFLKRYEIDIESANIQLQSGQYLESQKEIILENYKEKIRPQIIELVEKSNQVSVLELEIGLDEDSQSNQFGKIILVNMLVQASPQKPNQKLIQIPKIKVGVKSIQNHETGENTGQIEGQIKQNIKTCLIDFYNLHEANINITVQKNS